MDVYLVPVGRGRFELYSEAGERTDPIVDTARPAGWWARLVSKFQVVLASVERDRDDRAAPARGDAAPGRPRLGQRIRNRMLRWLAERVAEQRLLWHLRGVRAATLHVPAGLDESEGRRLLRAILRHDANRHLVWCVVNGAVFAASGIIAPVPGPNLIAYYFAFRLVGHALSWRGARHGLSATDWSLVLSGPLGELSAVATLPEAERPARIRAIADTLGLRRLPTFVARTSAPAG